MFAVGASMPFKALNPWALLILLRPYLILRVYTQNGMARPADSDSAGLLRFRNRMCLGFVLLKN
jgi:hypothetical protein